MQMIRHIVYRNQFLFLTGNNASDVFLQLFVVFGLDEILPAVVAAEERFASAFGMRHQAGHIALFIADAGDVLQRAVGIRGVGRVSAGVAVLPQNLVVGLELRERFFVGKVAAFAVRDGHAEN